ncbi:hypothetical protein [Kitasatospora sp. NPDC056184]|uniref:hypothetical protein n=1 Tax=Kitasatospora sp. NPDC056184 TaxID=3345738 RepID=UPI0035E0B2EA
MSTIARRPHAVRTLLAAALLALGVGCAAPGELRDHGAAAAVTPPPARLALWPDRAAAPSPEPGPARVAQPTPLPVPDMSVAEQDVTSVDVRTLLAKDPEVGLEERRALDPCEGCEIRNAEYRDLTGDGRPELLVVVGLVSADVLHVYTVSDDRLLSILRVQLLKRFGAEMVGIDLWLYEPTTVQSRTSRRFSWDGTRLVLAEQKVEGIGPMPDTSAVWVVGSYRVPTVEDYAVTAVPRPEAPSVRQPTSSAPGSGAGAPAPQPYSIRPVTPTAVPTAAPTARPPARPEAKP